MSCKVNTALSWSEPPHRSLVHPTSQNIRYALACRSSMLCVNFRELEDASSLHDSNRGFHFLTSFRLSRLVSALKRNSKPTFVTHLNFCPGFKLLQSRQHQIVVAKYQDNFTSAIAKMKLQRSFCTTIAGSSKTSATHCADIL